MAAPGSPLLVVEDPASLQLEVRLDATRATLVSLQQSVAVRIDGDAPDTADADGRVAEISRIDPDAHAFAVKIDVPANPAWRSGLFGRARFPGPPRQTLVVPARAIVRRGQLTFVFVPTADGHAELRAVVAGETRADQTELLSGIGEGERVIVDPPPSLHDGAPIRTVGGVQ